MTDTHAHLDWMEDLEAALEAAADLRAILTVGTNPERSERNLRIAERYPNVYVAVGLHPTEAEAFDEDVRVRLRELSQHPKVRAIGESGLDYYWDAASSEKQYQALDFQAELAEERGVPLVFHVRSKQGEDQAERELVAWLAFNRPKRFVLHAFGGHPELARVGLELGGAFSFAGNLTYKKNEALREAARALPEDRVLVETDSPFLPPQPKRGQKNQPAYVRFTLEGLAAARGVLLEELERVTDENAERVFNWKESA